MTESPLGTRSDLTPVSDFLYGSYFDPTLDVTLRDEKQKGIARHPNDDPKIPQSILNPHFLCIFKTFLLNSITSQESLCGSILSNACVVVLNSSRKLASTGESGLR